MSTVEDAKKHLKYIRYGESGVDMGDERTANHCKSLDFIMLLCADIDLLQAELDWWHELVHKHHKNWERSNLMEIVQSFINRAEKAEASVEELEGAVIHWFACLDAARAEGLEEVLQRTEDERLKDLFNRRLFYDTEAVFTKALNPKEK